MFKPSKKIAGALSAAAIAGTAGLVALAPAANAGTVTPTLMCKEPVMLGEKSGAQAFTMNLSSESGPAPGTVSATIDAGENPIRPEGSFPNITFKGLYVFDLSTGGEVTLESPPFTATVGATSPIDPPEFTTDLQLPQAAPGTTIDLTLKRFDIQVFLAPEAPDPPLTTAVCEVTGGNGVIASYKVADDAPQEPTLSATPGTVKPGETATVSGANWPSGTPTAELCDADGANCDAAKLSANTLTVADGALSGTATVADGVADGSYQLKVTVGDKSRTTPLQVSAEVPSNQRKITLTPDRGPVGTKVTVTGEGYTPNTQLYVLPVNAQEVPDAENLKTPTTDAEGRFSVEVTIGKADTTMIAASEDVDGILSAGANFTVDSGPVEPGSQLEQDISAEIKGGGLTIAQENAGIKLSDITLNGTAQNMTGALNTVTVKDLRGGATGWTLTGAVTDFTTPEGGKISADKFSWTPDVKTSDGSPSSAVAGSAGPIGNGATLASAPDVAEGTGGTFAADAELSLAVPAYQQPGTYSATLTISIS